MAGGNGIEKPALVTPGDGDDKVPESINALCGFIVYLDGDTGKPDVLPLDALTVPVKIARPTTLDDAIMLGQHLRSGAESKVIVHDVLQSLGKAGEAQARERMYQRMRAGMPPDGA